MKAITLLALFGSLTIITPSFAAVSPNGTNANGNVAGTNNNGGSVGGTNANNGGNTGTNGSGGNTRVARTFDELFLQQSAQAALFEIAMGQLALSNSQDAAVQAFAQELIQDHTAQLELLQTFATNGVSTNGGFTIPDTLTTRDQTNITRLSSLSGVQFDRAWTRLMVSGHVSAFALHQRAAQRARGESVRAYARSLLEPLAAHLTTALELTEQLRTTTVTRRRVVIP